MMDCDPFRGKIYDFLYDVLEGEEREAFLAHIEACEACRAKLEEGRNNLKHFSKWETPEFSDEWVRQAIRTAKSRERVAYPILRKYTKFGLIGGGIAVAAFLLFLFGFGIYLRNLHPDPQELVFMGEASLVPGTRASARVFLRDHDSRAPVQNAAVQVRLVSRKDPKARNLSWTLNTGARGVADVDFLVPDWPDGDYEFEVRAVSDLGTDVVNQSMRIHRPLKVLLSTDKPIYQPGQAVRIRTLALYNLSQKPAGGADVLVEVRNPDGIKVFKKMLKASRFGLASCAMQLAAELDLGPYRISATVKEVTTQKTVTVKKYVLPKFKVEVRAEKNFYLPGENLSGEIHAGYFFGKPVAGAEVTVTGVSEGLDLTASGSLDEKGRFDFSLSLPSSWVGLPLGKGKGLLRLEVEVTDTAGHAEKAAREIVIASDPFDLYLFPEGGRIANGVENGYFLYLARPDGTPCSADVTVKGKSIGTKNVRIDRSGVGAFQALMDEDFFPLVCEVRTAGGKPFSKRWDTLTGEHGLSPFLLVPDKSIYAVGDTARFKILSPARGKDDLFLDIVRGGQTALTRIVDVEDGRGEVDIDLDAGLRGLLHIHLYRIDKRGDVERDTRLVFVRDNRSLKVRVDLDREVYKPGDEVKAVFVLTGSDGSKKPGALSLCAVDEAVFALQEIRPGFLETYFQIEEEILDPKYQVKTAPILPITEILEGPSARASAAVASRSAFPSESQDPPNSYLEKLEAVREVRGRGQGFIALSVAIIFLCVFLFALIGLPSLSVGLFLTKSKYAPIPLIAWLGIILLIFLFFVILISMNGCGLQSGRKDCGEACLAPSQAGEMEGAVPRIRRHFPETLLWVPELVTDEQGRAEWTFPLADSITTWRLTAQAVTATGNIGSAEVPIRVFQDFFVDLDLPVELTRNDEIELPAVVYNYLESRENVRLSLETGEGIEVLGPSERSLEPGPNEVESTSFRIKAMRVGRWTLRLTGFGRLMSDALEREIRVVPDGRPVVTAASDFLGEEDVELAFAIPADTIPDSQTAVLKFYPGPVASVVEGLEKIVRMPFG